MHKRHTTIRFDTLRSALRFAESTHTSGQILYRAAVVNRYIYRLSRYPVATDAVLSCLDEKHKTLEHSTARHTQGSYSPLSGSCSCLILCSLCLCSVFYAQRSTLDVDALTFDFCSATPHRGRPVSCPVSSFQSVVPTCAPCSVLRVLCRPSPLFDDPAFKALTCVFLFSIFDFQLFLSVMFNLPFPTL